MTKYATTARDLLDQLPTDEVRDSLQGYAARGEGWLDDARDAAAPKVTAAWDQAREAYAEKAVPTVAAGTATAASHLAGAAEKVRDHAEHLAGDASELAGGRRSRGRKVLVLLGVAVLAAGVGVATKKMLDRGTDRWEQLDADAEFERIEDEVADGERDDQV